MVFTPNILLCSKMSMKLNTPALVEQGENYRKYSTPELDYWFLATEEFDYFCNMVSKENTINKDRLQEW